MHPYPPRPKAGYGPWLVALAALLLALAALVLALTRGAPQTRYVDLSRMNATLAPGTDCVDGAAVARDTARSAGAGRRDRNATAAGGTLDELTGRVRTIAMTGFARPRCRVVLLSSTPDCASSLTAPRVVTAAAGPTRQGYGETGAGAILEAVGPGSGARGVAHSELRLVDGATPPVPITIADRTDLLAQACPTGGAGVQPAGFVAARAQASAAPASGSVRDLVLIGGLVLALTAVAATMGRRRVR